ncbi:MAG: GTP 3',8-cyclase MoaA [Puniceicoccaceae bacterium]|nr:GTP 3',8-cyclase MoaA [Puniceicoccaceae bacterium]
MIKDKIGRRLTDLRISLTDQCNLRCTYCMPKEIFGPNYPFLKRSEWLHFDELDALVEAFLCLGVKKIRLTGGEPLLRPGIVNFVERLKNHHNLEEITLTTNALRLAKEVHALKDAGLSRVTVSLDALDPRILGEMNGRGISPEIVLKAIEAALSVGLKIKVNMVVQKGVNEGEILPMARYFKGLGVPLRFIEYMDVGNHNRWEIAQVFSANEILKKIQTEFEVEPIDLSSSAEVSKRYRYKNHTSEFGLITSVTQPFCGGCTRARITADGKLYTCLFASTGLDLKKILRSEKYDNTTLLSVLSKHWGLRDDRYSELRAVNKSAQEKVEMSYIGG